MIPTRYILSDVKGFNEIVNCDVNNLEILKLTKMESRTSNNSTYKVVRYDKNLLSIDLIPTYGLCRSLIINNKNKVVGFAPPKSIPCEQFIQKYTENTHGVVAEEFVEGTMVNVFWDDSIDSHGNWEISTRNTVGATSSFYKGKQTKTFREMFLEAAKQVNLEFSLLDKKYSYSFILQHPENRIVVPFKKPTLYLAGVFSIVYENEQIFVDAYDHQDFRKIFFENKLMNVKFPQQYSFSKYSELIEKYSSMNTSYDIVGVVLHNKVTGERTKIRNPVYEKVRNLRGNQPNLQYQYLCLRQNGKVGDFLKFYPENKKDFSGFRDKLHVFTNNLFSNYISCYIKKERPLKEFSEEYRTHMFNIHQKFINELREIKLFVTNTIVQKYVNELHPSLLMYCLNLQMRKRNIDTIVADSNM